MSSGKPKAPVADGPVARSVMIRGTSGQGLTARRPASISKPSSVASVASIPVIHHDDNSTSSWNVNELPIVPPYFPLERTHVKVEKANGKDVAQRLVDSMRDASIAAVYSSEKAMASAETSDNVRFDVRLFQESATEESIVVEMQKRSGSCFGFHDAARALLPAALGIESDSKPSGRRHANLKSDDGPNIDRLEEALDLSRSLLAKDRLDANLLGMESLVHLTSTSSPEAKIYISRRILSGDDGITDVLMQFIEEEFDDDEDDDEKADESHQAIMQRHSLCVLGNCLDTLDNDQELSGVMVKNDWIGDQLLKSLIKTVSDASMKPHDAYEGARGLNAMFRSSPRLKSKAKPLGLKQATITALNEGLLRHALLASETETLMKQIQSETEN
mmetsp:Transcript_34116/g.52357  ORF Transcript_34116/g.52357 Transcript_34116/m.52357 type:complete len:389 (+) Transcript_34116:22-1188(+)